MRYFTTEDIGPTRKLTPDGFLICLGVPIGRTGRMVYSINDLPNLVPGEDGHTILVDRYPDELFHPDTIASFEGMPLVDDHPAGYMMSPSVFRKHVVGHQQNVRPGDAEGKPDCLLADLFVMDDGMIAKILAGKKQVSAGYDADYKLVSPGVYRQTDIRGNHNAFVTAGRCGPRCAVGDTAPNQPCGCDTPEACTCNTPSRKDRIMAARANLKTALLTNIAKTFDEAGVEEGGDGTHIHMHLPGATDARGTKDDVSQGSGKVSTDVGANPQDVQDKRTEDQKTKDAEADARLTSMEGRLETLEDMLCEGTTDARLQPARDRKAARDAKAMKDKRTGDAEETAEEKEARLKKEKEDKETMDKRMRDGDTSEKEQAEAAKTTDAASNSAYFEPEFTETLANVKLLVPDMTTLPTFDSAKHFASTAATLCNLRKAALKAALSGKHKDAVEAMGFGSVATIDSAPCGIAKVAFVGAVNMIRGRNNGKMGLLGGLIKDVAVPANKGARTAAEINAANDKRWNTPHG